MYQKILDDNKIDSPISAADIEKYVECTHNAELKPLSNLKTSDSSLEDDKNLVKPKKKVKKSEKTKLIFPMQFST